MVSPLERSSEPSPPPSPSFDSLDLGTDPADESLSARLDRAVLALDRLRDRPAVSAAMAVGALGLLVTAWWLGRPPAPIDDLDIPYTPGLTADVAALTGGPNATGAAPAAGEPVGGPSAGAVPSPSGSTTTSPPDLVVHVAGAVARPGIVRVEAGARVADVVTAAGGAVDDADLDRLNLAAPVVDGMQVRVPAVGEPATTPTGIAAPPPITTGGDGGLGGGPGAGGPAGGLVDLNRADAAALETLHGIGPALAEAIIGWRTDNGPFVSVDQLLEVPGIGPATLDGLADDVAVR
ncbi:MAG: ComEA family DNA-binding protein [Actinomycetota bacterium]